MLLAFSWTIVLCFIGFQYLREKQYKSDFLNAQLQLYNRHLLDAIEVGVPYEDYIDSHEKPFDSLRVSIITFTGTVVYDNTLNQAIEMEHNPVSGDKESFDDPLYNEILEFAMETGKISASLIQ